MIIRDLEFRQKGRIWLTHTRHRKASWTCDGDQIFAAKHRRACRRRVSPKSPIGIVQSTIPYQEPHGSFRKSYLDDCCHVSFKLPDRLDECGNSSCKRRWADAPSSHLALRSNGLRLRLTRERMGNAYAGELTVRRLEHDWEVA